MIKIKRIMLFIVANVFIVGFVFFLPKYPLPSIAVLLLLITNLLCHLLIKAWSDRDISQIKTMVGKREVTTAVKLLRYAASALAFISFITTAEGLHEFVFTGEKVWQAYLASFAVQSILLVFNFLFFHFYIRINGLIGFPKFLKRILTYFVVLLFVVALSISSTFSFVFIANNTYASMRAKNSNITIESFLKEEAYRLKSVNEDIIKHLRVNMKDGINTLQTIIATNNDMADTNETGINNILSNFSINKLNAVTEDFYTQDQLNADLIGAAYPEEFRSAYSTFAGYRNTYDSIYTSSYASAYNFYSNIRSAEDKSQFTNETAIQTQINALEALEDDIDSYITAIENYETKTYERSISHYKRNAATAYKGLKSSIAPLREFFQQLLPVYHSIAVSTSTIIANSISVKSILNVVYTNEYNEQDIKDIKEFLSGVQEGQFSAIVIDENQIKNIADFREIFDDYVKCVELNSRINDLIDGELSKTYYIKGEMETDIPKPDGNLLVVSEAEWTKKRKDDFSKFIACLKLLPNIESNKEISEASNLVREYEPEQVMLSAYTMNRDLLENISGFEKALNYFKYDFNLMAILSLAIALFMDIASFLTGGFMFAASFFQDLKEEADGEKQLKQGGISTH